MSNVLASQLKSLYGVNMKYGHFMVAYIHQQWGFHREWYCQVQLLEDMVKSCQIVAKSIIHCLILLNPHCSVLIFRSFWCLNHLKSQYIIKSMVYVLSFPLLILKIQCLFHVFPVNHVCPHIQKGPRHFARQKCCRRCLKRWTSRRHVRVRSNKNAMSWVYITMYQYQISPVKSLSSGRWKLNISRRPGILMKLDS